MPTVDDDTLLAYAPLNSSFAFGELLSKIQSTGISWVSVWYLSLPLCFMQLFSQVQTEPSRHRLSSAIKRMTFVLVRRPFGAVRCVAQANRKTPCLPFFSGRATFSTSHFIPSGMNHSSSVLVSDVVHNCLRACCIWGVGHATRTMSLVPYNCCHRRSAASFCRYSWHNHGSRNLPKFVLPARCVRRVSQFSFHHPLALNMHIQIS